MVHEAFIYPEPQAWVPDMLNKSIFLKKGVYVQISHHLRYKVERMDPKAKEELHESR